MFFRLYRLAENKIIAKQYLVEALEINPRHVTLQAFSPSQRAYIKIIKKAYKNVVFVKI